MGNIRTVLNNEIAQIVGVIIVVYTFVAMVILPIKAIEKDIKIIQTNHLTHIEKDIEEITSSLDKNNKEHTEIFITLTQITTVLDEHLKAIEK